MEFAVEIKAPPSVDRDTMSGQVAALVAKLNSGVVVERRRHERVAIAVLFRLTPLDEYGQPMPRQSIVVVGKNISLRGISFIHNRPLSYRRARITLIQPGIGHFDAEVDIRWCRFTRPEWYESGGRLLRTATREWRAAELDPSCQDA
jgi:hypothetical protein